MREIWDRIERWWASNVDSAPFPAAAGAEDVAAAQDLGLPEEYVASLRVHDGDVPGLLGGPRLLSFAESRRLAGEAAGWPIADDGDAGQLVLDRGRVVAVGEVEDPREVASGFGAWLEAIAADLEEGRSRWHPHHRRVVPADRFPDLTSAPAALRDPDGFVGALVAALAGDHGVHLPGLGTFETWPRSVPPSARRRRRKARFRQSPAVATALNPGMPVRPDPADLPWDGADAEEIVRLAEAVRAGLAAGRVVGLPGFGEFVPVGLVARNADGSPVRVAVFSAYPALRDALRV